MKFAPIAAVLVVAGVGARFFLLSDSNEEEGPTPDEQRQFDLRNTSVSDAGIAALSGTRITFLDIRNSKVTGKVVETLLNMSGLEKVYVDQKFMGTPAFNRLADAGVKLATKDEFND